MVGLRLVVSRLSDHPTGHAFPGVSRWHMRSAKLNAVAFVPDHGCGAALDSHQLPDVMLGRL